MESCGDCGKSREAVRVKEEPEHPPSPGDCYLATPIKEETDNARPADCLHEAHYVKEEALCVDSEDQEASCSETAAWGGASAAAMLAGLYADHTIKDELVLGPEVLHRPNITPVFRDEMPDDQPDSIGHDPDPASHSGSAQIFRDCYLATPIKEETDNARPADCLHEAHYVKEEALCVDSEDQEASCSETAAWGGASAAAMLAGLYADHTIKDELVLGPEVLHRPNITPVFRDEMPDDQPDSIGHDPDPASHSGSAQIFQPAEPAVSARGREQLALGCSVRLERLRDDQVKESILSGRKTYSCEQCGRFFRNKTVLRRHIQLNHVCSETVNDPLRKKYACNFCSLTSQTKLDLLEHNKSEHGVTSYMCADCEYSTVYKKRLQTHLKSHATVQTRSKSIHCSYSSLTTKTGLRHHQMIHDGEESLYCSKCGFKTSGKLTLKSHLRTHLSQKPFECSDANFKSKLQHKLKHQRQIHTSTRATPFQCSYCDYSSSQKAHLQRHPRTHTGEKPFQCSQCDYKCNKKQHLHRHLRTHTGEKRFQCTYCDYKCNLKYNLQSHLRTHTAEKPFQCSYCDFKSKWNKSLKTHLRTHTGEKPFQCTYCDFKSKWNRSLQAHLRTHTGKKPFQCSQCDYKCIKKANLQRHLRTHTGEKPFQCSYCDYNSSRKELLQTHLRTHTGEKPFQCSQCDYKCIKKANLQRHLRTHTGEKPFQCSYCDYNSSRKELLQTHLRTHTGEKPFHCTYCDYKSIQKPHLRHHLRTHTGEKPFQCSQCDYKCNRKVNLHRHLRKHIGEK